MELWCTMTGWSACFFVALLLAVISRCFAGAMSSVLLLEFVRFAVSCPALGSLSLNFLTTFCAMHSRTILNA